jgi:hypothetical protein
MEKQESKNDVARKLTDANLQKDVDNFHIDENKPQLDAFGQVKK